MILPDTELRISPPLSAWRSRLIFALLVSLCFVALLLATGLVWKTFFNDPPIALQGLNPQNLGVLCPGEVLMVENEVNIQDDVIVHYFISVLDEKSNQNIPGTQKAYTDRLHPHPAAFTNRFEWTVPDLPPGSYTRVFAVRKVSGDEDTVFIINLFTIGECE